MLPPLVSGSYALNASFWRGGTSNGLLILERDLPKSQDDWGSILSGAMGSPDPYGRQLDGMGGGISSLSKVCVVRESTHPDADVDYTFIQVGVTDGSLDMAGNCGNMSSAVGPFALDHGLVSFPQLTGLETDDGPKEVTVRILNTNTGTIIHSQFAAVQQNGQLVYEPRGTYSIDGVAGTASRITLSFLQPGGCKTGLVMPTGKPSDLLMLPGGSSIRASCIDVANPGVFVRASDVDVQLRGPGTTNTADDPCLKARLEAIRQAGAQAMGLDPTVQSIPKIVLLAEPQSEQGDADIACLAISMGQAHKAVPITLALNLATTANIPGSVAWDLRRRRDTRDGAKSNSGPLTIIHPSGKLQVQAIMEGEQVISGSITRTARQLMQGQVFFPQQSGVV